MPAKQLTVTASISRNYGPMTVNLSASEVITAEKYGDVVKAHQALRSAIRASFDDFEANELPKMPVAPGKGIEADTKPKGPQWYIAKEMYMSIQDGKKFYHIRTANNPKTNKFGAAVYFDRFKGMTEDEFKSALDPETFKHTLPDGMRVLIEEYKGKQRAIQIAHKDTIGEG